MDAEELEELEKRNEEIKDQLIGMLERNAELIWESVPLDYYGNSLDEIEAEVGSVQVDSDNVTNEFTNEFSFENIMLKVYSSGLGGHSKFGDDDSDNAVAPFLKRGNGKFKYDGENVTDIKILNVVVEPNEYDVEITLS